MTRRKRSDSTEFATSSANAKAPSPPDHIHLRESDLPFWESVVRARAYDSWNAADLETAANLARCKSDIERLQREVDAEGDVIENARGTMVMNPKHTLLETLSRRSVALSRMLQVHAEATQGRSRDTGKRTAEQNGIKDSTDRVTSGSDGLIPRPTH